MSQLLPESFIDLLVLWRVDPVGHSELILEAATELVAAGVGGVEVAALVAEGPDASRAGLRHLIEAVEAAGDVVPLTGEAAQDGAVAVMAKRYLAGSVTARELTYWTTRVVGLRGGDRSQIFINLETEYCQRLGDDDVSDIEQRVEAEARALAAGETSPSAAPEPRGLKAFFKRKSR